MRKQLHDWEHRDVDVYSGVRWSATGSFTCQAIHFLSSIVLARLLAPEYFGLLAMAMVFVGFGNQFSSMGFSQAIVQRARITEDLLNSLFVVTLVVGCLIAIVTALAGPVFAWIYSDPRVASMMAVLGLTFILRAPCLVPSALLTRRMAFLHLALIDVFPTALSAIASVMLALRGYGVWSLVWPTVAKPLIETPMLYAMSRWKPRLSFRWADVHSVLDFGANLTGFTVLNYFARQTDKFVIGAFLGATPLGFYSLAYRVLLRPRVAVTTILNRVLFPALSRMQQNDERLKAVYLQACGAIAFVTFPMMLGLTVVARPFVEVILGAKWLPAVPLIWVLAPLGMLLSISTTVGNLYLAKGRADLMFRWSIAAGALRTASFFVGLPWGILGVAISYAVTCVILWFPSIWIPFQLVNDLKVRHLFKVIAPYAWCAFAMALTVTACRAALTQWSGNGTTVLFVLVGTGVLSYTLFVFSTRPPALAYFLKLLAGHKLSKGRMAANQQRS